MSRRIALLGHEEATRMTRETRFVRRAEHARRTREAQAVVEFAIV
jgi:hypothetical protein